MKKIIFIIFIFSILLNISCTTDVICTESKYVKLNANFYHVIYNDTTKIRTVYQLSLDSLTVQGLKKDSVTGAYQPVDSILYKNQNGIVPIYLPLNNYLPESVFRFKFKTISDTMTIYHKNLNDYLSLECGCIVTHSIDTIITTHHYIDSLRIIIHDVNTINAENIRLYK